MGNALLLQRFERLQIVSVGEAKGFLAATGSKGFVTFLRQLLRNFGAQLAGMRQNLAFVEAQEGIKPASPIGHRHGFAAAGLILSKFQVHGDDPESRSSTP